MYIMLRYKNIEDKITDMTNLAITAALNSKTSEVINEIPSITNLATNASLNDKINEVKNKIPSITNIATSTALSAVENKIPNVSDLEKWMLKSRLWCRNKIY